MRRFIAFLLIAASLLSVSAADRSNYEKIYPIYDEIVEDMKDLYILSGLSLPSTAGPYSGSELKMALERIDPALLEGTAALLYSRIENKLDADAASAVFTGGITVSPEIYLHSNTSEAFQTWDNWLMGGG